MTPSPSRWPWRSLQQAAALAWLLWQVTPLWTWQGRHPFDPPGARLALLAGLAALVLAGAGARRWRDRRRNEALLGGLGSEARRGADVMQQRFAAALALLRTRQPAPGLQRGWRRGRYLYQLPWYLFIGAPGAGKTTALLHSGLKFPLASRLGQTALAGVGGTRHCDWWFTDRAVFIDTAGRYTTQDSDAPADADEWRRFLGLLRRHRPDQPLNGVLVTVSVADLLAQGAGGPALLAQARAVDERLQELRRVLGQGFPVYLLVTKADLLAGFAEFFGTLDAAARDPVWGVTFAAGGPFDAACLQTALQDLTQRLVHRTPACLQSALPLPRRGAIVRFAAQLEALAAPLQAFGAAAFRQVDAAPAQAVRGVFLTSGTQEGNPIDRVLGSLTRGFGLRLQPLPRPDGAGKAYFLGHLLRERLVEEAPLAGRNLPRRRRLLRLERGVMVAAAVALVALLGLCGWSAKVNADYLAGVQARIGVLAAQTAAAGGQVDRLLPLYAMLRDLADATAQPLPAPGLGLAQRERVALGAEQSYRHLLDRTLAPVLAQRLTAMLADPHGPSAERAEALRLHAMLQMPAHLRRDEWRAWALHAFALDARGAGVAPGERQEWAEHLDRLLQRNALLDVVRVDPALIRRARDEVLRRPLEERAYERLLVGAGAGADPAWPVPAPFGVTDWRDRIRPRLAEVATRVVDEAPWVYGEPVGTTAAALAEAMRQRYAADFQRHWEAALAREVSPDAPPEPRARLERLRVAFEPPPQDLLSEPALQALRARLAAWQQRLQQQAAPAAAPSPDGAEPGGTDLQALARTCRALTVGWFPFDPQGRRDLPLQDFTRLLGPDGAFDTFTRAHRGNAGGWSAATRRSIEQAASLRGLFFAAGGTAPALRLQLVPVELDAALFWFSLDADGQALRYENGPRRARTLAWPSTGPGRVLLRIPKPDSSDTVTEIHEGPWALWRVLLREPWQRGEEPRAARVRLAVEGHALSLDLRLDDGGDPWPLRRLAGFRCPEGS